MLSKSLLTRPPPVSAPVDVACAVCGTGDPRPVQQCAIGEQRYTLVECRSCGLQGWEPRSEAGGGAAYYEGEALGIYRNIHEDPTLNLDDQRSRRFFSGHGRLRGGRVLDVGCGSGGLLWPLAQQGNQVWGIDFDARSVEAARRRGLTNVRCESAEDFVKRARVEGLKFDLITAFDVIEHLVDPLSILVQLREFLVPAGRLVVTVPNRKRLLVDSVGTDFPPHHLFRFDQASLASTLERAGYTKVACEEFDYGYAGAFALDVVRRLVRRGHAARRVAGAPLASEPEVLRPLQGRAAAYLRSTLPRALNRLSAPLERVTGRGFKLYASGLRS